MISFRDGDMFASGLPALAHGVNCKGVMGAGVAAEFRRRHPQMYDSYRRRCARRGGMIPGDVMSWHHQFGWVFNLATQPVPGASAQPWMITAAIGRMITEAYHDCGVARIGMPLIGCGIGGLTREDLVTCLHPYSDAPVDLVVFTLPPRKAQA